MTDAKSVFVALEWFNQQFMRAPQGPQGPRVGLTWFLSEDIVRASSPPFPPASSLPAVDCPDGVSMEQRPIRVLFRAFLRGAGFGSVFLFLIAAPSRVDAQQGLPLPPAFKDLAAVGVAVNPGQPPVNGGANQQNPVGSGGSDPNHVFGTPAVFGNPGFGNPGFGNGGFGNPSFGNAGFGNAGFGNAGAGMGSNSGPAPTVLVSKNGRVVQGTIRTDARGYSVESPRSNLYFPFEHVKFVAADLHDAYAKLSDSIGGSSARRDLLLGRWCLENGLPPEAADHFRNVLNVDPSNREARQALARLDQTQSEEPAPADERGAKTRSPAADAQVPESLSRLSGSAVREFVIGIQPMLLARCGSVKCHGGGGGGADASSPGVASFRLEHVRLSQGSNRSATARNLAAVLNLLDGQFPSQSPLFQQGLQPHGGLLMRAPLDGPAGRAQEMRLRRWVETVSPERNRLRREDATRAFVSRFARSQKPAAVRDANVTPASAAVEGAVEGTGNEAGQPESITPPAAASAGLRNSAGSPRQLGPLADPFDPSQFNAGQSNGKPVNESQNSR